MIKYEGKQSKEQSPQRTHQISRRILKMKRVEVTTTLALCLLLTWAIGASYTAQAGTYVENFDDGDFDGWEIFEGGEPGSEWTVEDGVLTCRREILWISELLFGEEDWRNYTIECDAKMVEPLGDELCFMGFDFRIVGTDIVDGLLDNDDVCSVVEFFGQEASISAWINNEFSGTSESKGIDFELDRWYRFKAVAHEDTFEFYIDGRLVASYTDDRFPTGRIGFFVAACEAQFDNVIITGDDVPDNTDSMVAGDLLAAMYWFEEAWRVHSTDLLFSVFTDDYIADMPPYPPMNKEEVVPIVEWYMATYPTIYVLDEGFRMASAKDGVGFAEHTDVYAWPDNGAPIEEFHICLLDFRGPKPKRITVYSDYGTSLIQAGVMPPRKLGDMIPSFPLPAPEPTGLASMEASAELIARLNSHDLSSVAKMLRSDVDIWFPFIGRPANRSELIDIHEQFLGGFSDMSWENVRRVDMGDGWLFSEVKLRGTNDGKFLGKPATGLPMEVRSGLIEHYDENGLADYVHFHFDTLSVPGQGMPTDQAKEEMLTLMVALDDAYNAHDTELVVSFFTDDAIFDCPPDPPFDKEVEREFLEWIWEAWPNFTLANPLNLASVSDKVGVTEHSDLYSHPDTGAPIETPHICVKDFEGDKMTRLTVYGDFWADELIQAGLMPPRELGDMVPSFSLPDIEPTGLSPMEASTELMARLNSGDLPNVAKMIRKDVDVWFPFINRTATRSEFIDIYEQMLGGFSDAKWETIRRVDMGDGWVYYEATLKGTNDGEFLGKPATGLPMEVRGGWVEHYDENGLATYLHAHFDSLSMPGQEAPTEPAEDFSNVFFIDLTQGLNMISLPLKPQTPYTARSLAEEIGATAVIEYDEVRRRFVGFTPASSGDGFPIEGGKGYIVNVLEGKTHTFTGAAWTNEPSVEAAPSAESNSSGWAFIVSGAMIDGQGSDYMVAVRNLRTGTVATDAIADSRFDVVFADLNRNTVIEAGDKVELIIRDSSNKIVAGPVTYQIGQEDIRKAFRDIVIPYGYSRPEKNVLLQNYPNPFNPETWIPFHLAQDADVSVRIYDASGKLIRTLSLGHREAGFYVAKGKAVYWNGKSDAGEKVASGVYFYSINAGDFSATRKLIVRK